MEELCAAAGALLGQGWFDIGEIQSGREVVTVAIQDAHADLAVGAEMLIRRSKLFDRREVEGVALLRPVDADEQNVAVTFDADPVVHLFPFLRGVRGRDWNSFGKKDAAFDGYLYRPRFDLGAVRSLRRQRHVVVDGALVEAG